MLPSRSLDRVPYFDERSLDYAAIDPSDTRPLRSNSWSCNVFLDQGEEGACVGFAWAHHIGAEPDSLPVDNGVATSIYEMAKARFDPWPGSDYEGTTVLAGVKAAKRQGYISEYRWAFGIEDLCRVLGYAGPVVLGVNWYAGMSSPDTSGYVKKAGTKMGCHAILANSITIIRKDNSKPATWDNVDLDISTITLHNSWGVSWGRLGECYLSLADMKALLKEDGEACVPVKRRAN